MFKRLLKNERGLTLIELLAVVVILGIISAIAVPSIGGLIDNTKKDAHIANAQQMVNAARLAYASDSTVTSYTLKDLISNGYLEPLEKPGGGKYDEDNSVVKLDGKIWRVTLKTGNKVHFENEDPYKLPRSKVTLD